MTGYDISDEAVRQAPPCHENLMQLIDPRDRLCGDEKAVLRDQPAENEIFPFLGLKPQMPLLDFQANQNLVQEHGLYLPRLQEDSFAGHQRGRI